MRQIPYHGATREAPLVTHTYASELLQLLTLFKRFRSEPCPGTAGSDGHLQIQRMEGQGLPLCGAKTNKAPWIR
ncbi:hypothetical protein AB1E18_007763 [Capra hircus]